MTRDIIEHTAPLRQFDNEYTAPNPIAPPDKNTDMSSWLETLDDYLFKTYGAYKTPLLYVIRDTVAMPAGANPATAYESSQAKMI